MMHIDDLERVLKLCRREGVTEIELGDIKIKLGEKPRRRGKEPEADEAPTFQSELVGDDLIFYSVRESAGNENQ